MPRRLIDNDARREQRRQALLLERISRKYERAIASDIARTTREIVKAWAASGQIKAPEDHEKMIFLRLNQLWRDSIETMAGRIYEQAKVKGQPHRTKGISDFFQRIQQAYLQTIGGYKIAEDIARTTVTQIMVQVARGRAEGLGQDAISQMINDNAADIGRYRGAVIARTETHASGNFGALEAAKDSGLQMQKEWISAQGERTREAHAAADGQIVMMDEPFIVDGEELMFPGDPQGSAGNVINCRCAQGFVVMD